MPSSFQHDPVLTVAASNTTAGAAVKWVAAKNIGESLIILDSGGNGRIGLAGDLDLITLTANTVTVAGTVAATTLTGAGAGITALAAANITASGTLPALNGAALTALNGTQVTSGTLPAARIAADSIVEAKLDVSNGPTNGQFLQAQSGEGGGLTWAAAGGDLSFGGDTFGADKVIGSNDNYALSFETGGVVRMKIHGQVTDPTSAGAITMPTQPAVAAYNSSQNSNVTGAGTTFTVEFDTEVFDQGADYNNATDTFTAPVTGRYQVSFQIYTLEGTTAGGQNYGRIVTSNRNWGFRQAPRHGTYDVGFGGSILIDMDADDILTITYQVVSESSDIVDVYGANQAWTFFSVHLVA